MTTSAAVDQFMPLAVQTLVGAGEADFDLYVHSKGGHPLLFRSRSVPLADDDLQRLIRSGVRTVLIRYDDRMAYEQHLHDRLTDCDDLSLSGKYALLRETARLVFESALRGDSVAGMVGVAEQFGTQMADVLCDRTQTLRGIFDLMLHDYCTFTHSANVATYCITLAQTLGISDRAHLAQIVTGALLHDIGKRKISKRVLNKPKSLSPADREAIQRHPQIGFEELSRDRKLTWSQLMMVYQHHERLDGCGYPVGIVDDEIDPWAKICAVADVFDALTCDRPYRKAMTVQEACIFLEQRIGHSFDQEIVRCLTTMMQPA
ncbi:MAG TPA: HD domain-containing phosphohydrolase [Pirellulales bacterium]|nr:HD domain-containing phosphohydrolase [Pirellulales bacterium]